MPAFKYSNISNVKFTIDEELFVCEANRNFESLFDITDCHINLTKYMRSYSAIELQSFLVNNCNDNQRSSFIAEFEDGRKIIKFFLFIIKKDNLYDIDLYDAENAYKEYTHLQIVNTEYAALLKNFNNYYFIWNGKDFTLKHTKELTAIFTAEAQAFHDYLVNTFNINASQDDTGNQLKALFNDLLANKPKRTYKLVLNNGKFVSISPRQISTPDATNFTICFISTENNENLLATPYSEKKDGLTELYNKKSITEQALHKINVLKQECSLIIIDIDKFKDFNDTFGHIYGDKVIKAVAKTIQETVNGIGIAGRIGGDEFLIVLDTIDEQDIRNVTRNIRMGIQWSITAADPENVVTCSMGIARSKLNADNYEELFKIADKCLYIAKNKGRNCYIIYKPELHDKVIIKNDDEVAVKSSGKLYMNNADSQIEILTLLNASDNRENIPLILDKLRSYIGVHQITVYDQDLIPVYSSGNAPDFRQPYFDKDYFKYHNAYNYLHLDNTRNFDTIDKTKHLMYAQSNVASTLEYVDWDEEHNVKSLICMDVFNPARTFAKDKLVFAIMMAKIIATLI